MEGINLGEIVDTKVLQDMQDKFCEATGLSAVTVDYRGIPVTRYSNFTPFCRLIRDVSTYEDRCHQCDAYGGIEAVRRNKPHLYRCHAGLVDFAVPIKVKGLFTGSVLAGQAKLEESELEQIDKITSDATDWGKDEILVKAYNQLSFTSLKKVRAGAQLLHSIISNLIEKSLLQYVQDELNQKYTILKKELKDWEKREKGLQEKELTFLESSLNINFLEHSLNTASRLAIIEKAKKTTESLINISDFLKYTVQKSNKLVRLEEEVAHIKRYLELQKLRFGDRFQYELDIPEEVRNQIIPSQILTAIIDNALVHGLETKNGKGFLKVSAEFADHKIRIQIIDNGVGIPADVLEQIRSDQDKPRDLSVKHTMGMDLFTVKRILKKYYGNDYKVAVNSHPYKGTSVMITISEESR